MLFENRPHYWEPADHLESIYDQLAQNKCREIPREDITYGKKQLSLTFVQTIYFLFLFARITAEIGSGEFGTVSKATWTLKRGRGEMEVAVKQLKVDASEEDRARFLREGARMMQFFHANVVRLHGMITVGPIVSVLIIFISICCYL